MQASLRHRLLTRRYPWIAFILTQLCPGWGQIYNRDWKWLGISFVSVVVLTTITTVYLFDSLKEIGIAICLGLVLDLFLSIQAYKRAKKMQEIQRPTHHYNGSHVLFRLICVYGGFTALLFAIPDGYGLFMPTRLRSFQIPSESMVPNLLVGDRLVADGWAYWGKEPKRGDVVVFDYPKDPSTKFVKRLIGLPGDVIEFKAGELWVNGEIVPQRKAEVFPVEAMHRNATEFVETMRQGKGSAAADGQAAGQVAGQVSGQMAGQKDYVIFRIQPGWVDDLGPITVPEGKYFMLGDNRDRSHDSRFWGFVSRDQLIGRMAFIYFSWDSDEGRPRMNRMGMQVN